MLLMHVNSKSGHNSLTCETARIVFTLAKMRLSVFNDSVAVCIGVEFKCAVIKCPIWTFTHRRMRAHIHQMHCFHWGAAETWIPSLAPKKGVRSPFISSNLFFNCLYWETQYFIHSSTSYWHRCILMIHTRFMLSSKVVHAVLWKYECGSTRPSSMCSLYVSGLGYNRTVATREKHITLLLVQSQSAQICQIS